MKLHKSKIDAKHTTDANGFLHISGAISRTGIQNYTGGAEYRPAEEVFNSESMDSFNGIPITIGHPDGLISTGDTKDHQVGAIKKVWQDGDFLKSDMIITDKEAIRRIKTNGLSEFSVGYRTDDEEKVGTHEGVGYKIIQRSIRANHLALLPNGQARCGGGCKIDKLDTDIKDTYENGVILFKTNYKKDLKMAHIKIDNVDYPIEDTGTATAISHKLDTLKAKIDMLEEAKELTDEELEKLKKEKEEKEDTISSLNGEVDALEGAKLDSDKIDALVTERIATISDAQKLDCKCDLNGLTTTEIKRKAIGVKADGKDDAYVSSMFEVMLDIKNDALAGDLNIDSAKNDGEEKTDARTAFMNKSKG